jgi:hypothetical protein
MDVPLGRLTPDTKGHIKYHLTGVVGAVMTMVLYHFNGTDVLGTITIDTTSGDIAGTLDLTDYDTDHLEMDVYEQVFEPGDVVREPTGSTHVAYAMSDEHARVMISPDYTQMLPSGEVERVGHLDITTLLD